MYKCSNCKKETDYLNCQQTELALGTSRIVPDEEEADLDFKIDKVSWTTIFTCPSCHTILTTKSSWAKHLLLGGKA